MPLILGWLCMAGAALWTFTASDIGQRQHVVRGAWPAGMLLVSLSLLVRKRGLWLVVPLFPLLLLVVRCLIVLLPCAFGMVTLNLARLIISLGTVLVASVVSPNLARFFLLGTIWLGRY